jgi:hypothetical protein
MHLKTVYPWEAGEKNMSSDSQNPSVKISLKCRMQWPTPVIPATPEVEMGRIVVQGQPG